MDPYKALANAIVEKAVLDYKEAVLYQLEYPESKSAVAYVKSQERFFRSDWFRMLTTLDGEYLIRKTKQIAEEEYNAYQLELSGQAESDD